VSAGKKPHTKDKRTILPSIRGQPECSHRIQHEWILFNPIGKVSCSAKRLREPDVFTSGEFQALLRELFLRECAKVMIAGSTGLRRSELFALRWSDVNFFPVEIAVTRSCEWNHFGDTKAKASRKLVPFDIYAQAVSADKLSVSLRQVDMLLA
jgi:integrase